MPPITARVITATLHPYRTVKRTSSKIIFLSCEGSVTEENYIDLVANLFSDIESKIKMISVAEDATHTWPKRRTPEQNSMLGKNRPKQLVERIDQYKIDRESTFEFSKYPEDEFWIVTDVDKNWSSEEIPGSNGKTYIEEWNEAISMCRERNYCYAISNPCFEMWLLLHHDAVNDEDRRYAVTETHAFESTRHYQERLRVLEVPLKDKKHISPEHYTVEKVDAAISRAKELHLDRTDFCPKYYATTIYLLLEKIKDMLPNAENAAILEETNVCR